MGLALALHLARPVPLPGSALVVRGSGAVLTLGAVALAARSVAAAGDVDLAQPGALVTTGPFAATRNPMYIAWSAIHAGIGLLAGTRWVCLTLPAGAWWVDREIRREERSLAATFGAEYEAYRALVPRYARPSLAA